MDTGKTVIARIPNPNAGPTILTTASEVATMDLLRTILHIPVPEVLAWNSAVNSTNRVGAEYIVMEHATGGNLADIWADMDLEHKKIAERFSIGPVVDTAFWSNERGNMNIDRGPWTSAIDYIRALPNREISWIKEYAIPRSPDDPLFTSYSQNDPAEHISLLQKYLTVTPHLIPRDKDILGSFLWHTDLRTPKIFVDNSGHITRIIDWQSTWAGPLFLEGRHPHFLDYAGDLLLKPPKNFKQLDNDTQKDLRENITRSILLYLYEKYTAKKNPLLDKVLRYPNGKILTHPIPLCRKHMGRRYLTFTRIIDKNPGKLDHPPPHRPYHEVPHHLHPNEIHKHHKDSEGWNEVQDFWDALSGILSRDGWTSHETYDQAVSIYAQIQDLHDKQHSQEDDDV
ncbi:phosphotransferase enzyme [Aspergillus niger]|nr:phosphotransferase enzyme [Aspergillus niger]